MRRTARGCPSRSPIGQYSEMTRSSRSATRLSQWGRWETRDIEKCVAASVCSTVSKPHAGAEATEPVVGNHRHAVAGAVAMYARMSLRVVQVDVPTFLVEGGVGACDEVRC